jgi:hypothetical protein
MPARWLRRWFRRSDSRPAARRSSLRNRFKPGPSHSAFALEDRQLLTILVTPHGGPVFPSVDVVTIYYGWDGVAADGTDYGTYLDGFIADVTGSTYLGDLGQYGVGKGTLRAGEDVPVATYLNPQHTLIGDGTIQAFLQLEIATDPAFPQPDGNTLYLVYTPPGVNVVRGTSVTGSGLLGYHDATAVNGTPIAYSVVPTPSLGAAFGMGVPSIANAYTAITSHELGEAVTDAYYSLGAPGWYYQTAAGEIGDLTVGQLFVLDGYVVQRLWSNLIAQSNFPHSLPLVNGNPSLPGVVRSPNAPGTPLPVVHKPNPPTPGTPPARPHQPSRPTLPGPIAPPTPGSGGPTIPGGASVVEPTIVASNYNPSDLALASQNGLVVSTDDGASWSTPVAFPTTASGDPSLAFDKTGLLYWASLNATTRGISLSVRNPTTGAAVGSPYTVSSPAAGFSDVQEFLAADSPMSNGQRNDLYIAWTRLGPGGSSQILLARSANSGVTWSSPVVVSSAGEGYVYGATVAVLPSGTVDVAYHSQTGFVTTADGGIVPDGISGQTLVASYAYADNNVATVPTLIAKSAAFAPGQSDISFNDQAGSRTIAGTTFSTQGSAIPFVLADPSKPNTIYVVTADDPNNGSGTSYSRVVFAKSTHGGAPGSWTTTTLDNTAGTSSQLYPTATIDAQGDIVVTWYDTRNAATNSAGHNLLDVFSEYSTDGGVTWSSSFQVNDPSQPFDPDASAPTVLNGPPPTTGIGNSFGVAIAGGTVFVAHNANVTTGPPASGERVTVDSFSLSGTLLLGPNPGNNVITVRLASVGSDQDVVLLNNVVVYTGSIDSISGGIAIEHDTDFDGDIGGSPNIPIGENDTLILDFSNGNPIPSGGIIFNAAPGGNNVIQVNADADYSLSDTGLTISGMGAVTLSKVANASLTGGASNNTVTLSGWSGSITVNGMGGNNTVIVASGSVSTSHLTLSNIQTLNDAGGTLTVNANFSVPNLLNSGTLDLANGVTLTSNVTNFGILDLGGVNVGVATISGNYTQTSAGTLNIRLGGTSAGQHDQLNITGSASLSGTLNVSVVNGYVPQVGDSLTFLTYASISGDFTSENGLNSSPGVTFVPQRGTTSYILMVEP